MILRKGYTLKGYKENKNGKLLIASLYCVDEDIPYDVSLSGNMYMIQFNGGYPYANMVAFVDSYSIFNEEADLIEEYKPLS